ncbi:MAG: chromosome partitioning protein ParB [Pseudorhodobacter sp. PARRP1]|nr:MAG: chromosome partitioning protein ParB [Pseudorhodobacter sp. PARRP1]
MPGLKPSRKVASVVNLIKAITDLPVSDIEIGSRLRDVAEAEVVALIELIREFGQTTPILVRKKKSGFVLVDGMHRLEATKRAGIDTIPVRVYEMTDDDAAMLEASQNLVGGMSPLDDAVFLAAWKKAHLHKHPETAAGVAGALAKHGLQGNSSSFAEIVATKRSISVRQVRKIIAAGEALGLQTIRLRQAPRPVTLKDLLELAKIGEPSEQIAVIDALVDGTAKSAGEARRVWKARETGTKIAIKDPVEQGYLAISALWARLPKAAKRRFSEEHELELRDLIDPLEAKVSLGPDEVEF